MQNYNVHFICSVKTHEVIYVILWEKDNEYAYLFDIKTISELSYNEETGSVKRSHTFKIDDNTTIMKFHYYKAFDCFGGIEFKESFKENSFLKDIEPYYSIHAIKYIQSKDYFNIFLEELKLLVSKYEKIEKESLSDMFKLDFMQNFVIFIAKDGLNLKTDTVVFLNKSNFMCFYTKNIDTENWKELTLTKNFLENKRENISDFDLCFIIKNILKRRYNVEKLNDFSIYQSEFKPIHYESNYYKVMKSFSNFMIKKQTNCFKKTFC